MTLRMRFSLLPSLFMLFHLLACGVTVQAEPLKMNLSHQKFILDNGLTVIVHEDRKAPIVAVNLWYHVGSKDEKPGKTGFAHLFEHLMFNGSEHHDDEYFKPFERVGATEMNGTTNNDRTNYFQNVPTSALDLALWMESDRMGHLLGAITQAKLDEQRGVVQNEKRQGENQPYGRVFEAITKACYPAGHPYSWEVIGSMTDLNAATLDDVHQWFKDYYGPSNAVLVLAGDIDLETAKQKVQHYFGDIAPGQPITRPKAWTAQRTGHQREVMQDRVPQPRLHQVWNVPELRDQNAPLFDLLGQLLAGGKNSRLYQRLVYRDQIATEVSAAYWGRELSGLFVITADVKKGHTLAEVEKAIDQELTTLLTQGPGQSELERVRAAYTAQFVREAERVGGTGGKSDLLASGEVFFDNPTAMVDIWLKQINAATPIALRDLSRKWLSDGRYTLEVEPFPTLEAAKEGADRSQLPAVDEPPQLKIPELERATLKNGLKVVLAQRHEVPLVQLTLQFDAGHSTDQGGKPGTQSFAMEMLTEGSSQYDALALADRLERLGATLTTSSTIDTSSLHLSTLKSNLTSSLGLFADVLLNPAFKSSEIERKRALWLARIEQEEASPVSLAMRLMPPLLYGEGHPYALPFTGSGTVAGVSSLKRDDLVNFHRTWFQPGRATLIVVGDTTLKELVPLLEQQLGQWRDRGAK
ncbi:MAG TPA: pitrilysin family protein, partial [Pseudomonadales bacterium]|nr:pitrilysin family protein [Pseudomonadales bacterium]